MMAPREQLPNDVERLKDLLLAEHQRAELFKYKYDCLAKHFFGPSSEKHKAPPGQQLLFALPAPEAQPAAPASAPSSERKRHGGGRRKLPPELVRHRIEYALPEEKRKCACCGEVMQPFGQETSEQLEYYPASLFVVEHVIIKYACLKHKCEEKPVAAPGPEKVVDKGLAAPGLLAWNVISKFGDHQPNYRQEDIFARHGLEIARSTQCGWQATVAELLEPLYKRMAAEVILSGKLHTDDTPIKVLEPGRGKTREARFWVYVGDDQHPFIVFDYTPNRSRDGPAKFLKTFKGYLQADAYTGYDRIYAGQSVIEVACWAHARRKFFEAKDTDARAAEMLALIGELYRVESLARPLIDDARRQLAEQRDAALAKAYALRRELRQAQSLPILTRVKTWLDARVLDVLPKSPLGQAVTYALNQWTALMRFIENGTLEPDNNMAENALRPICLGRKNYLFMGNDNGGRRAAILYSIVRTCERHGINAWEYLRDVLIRISTHPASRIDELLPHRWKPATTPLKQ
jgi:transposase